MAKDKQLEITLIDRRNHHLFSPLLYQVATGALTPSDIAQPLRLILRKQQNVRVLLAEALSLDPAAKTVRIDDGSDIEYDSLIVATGTKHSYFGNDAWADHAPGIKTLDDALAMRARILDAFEEAELEVHDPLDLRLHRLVAGRQLLERLPEEVAEHRVDLVGRPLDLRDPQR